MCLSHVNLCDFPRTDRTVLCSFSAVVSRVATLNVMRAANICNLQTVLAVAHKPRCVSLRFAMRAHFSSRLLNRVFCVPRRTDCQVSRDSCQSYLCLPQSGKPTWSHRNTTAVMRFVQERVFDLACFIFSLEARLTCSAAPLRDAALNNRYDGDFGGACALLKFIFSPTTLFCVAVASIVLIRGLRLSQDEAIAQIQKEVILNFY